MPRSLLVLCTLVVAGFVAPPARAGLLPTAVSVTAEVNSEAAVQFRWTYAIVLPTDSQLQTGNYFTIYDFGGFVPGSSAQPDGWEFTASNVGPTPTGVDPQDDPALVNLHWRYVGPTTEVGQVGLGNFWAVSNHETAVDSFFTARTNRVSDGHIDTNITSTTVPVPTGSPPPGVPEPATLALAALGLPLVGLARWARRRRTCG